MREFKISESKFESAVKRYTKLLSYAKGCSSNGNTGKNGFILLISGAQEGMSSGKRASATK